MPTYYEFLGIESSASAGEIESKLDELYEKSRQLVTNHDPDIVAKANQTLRVLEKIREVLMDDKKKKAYDASLSAGGLADPDAPVITSNPFLPLGALLKPVRSTDVFKNQMERTDAWICTNQKCKHANAVGEQHCAQCGTRIGMKCPKCDALVELSKKFCSNCGVNKQDSFAAKQAGQVKELMAAKHKLEDDISEIKKLAESGLPSKSDLYKYGVEPNRNVGCLVFLIVIGAIQFLTNAFADGGSGFLGIILLGIGIFFLVSNHGKNKTKLLKKAEEFSKSVDSINKEISQLQQITYGQQEY